MTSGIEIKFKNQLYPVLIAPTHIKELTSVTHSDDGVTFGASTTLSTIDETLKKLIEKHPGLKNDGQLFLPMPIKYMQYSDAHTEQNCSMQFNVTEHKTRVFAAVVEMLRWFAGHQVRNVAVRFSLTNNPKSLVEPRRAMTCVTCEPCTGLRSSSPLLCDM